MTMQLLSVLDELNNSSCRVKSRQITDLIQKEMVFGDTSFFLLVAETDWLARDR